VLRQLIVAFIDWRATLAAARAEWWADLRDCVENGEQWTALRAWRRAEQARAS
jgi:hypothetical protein